MQKAAAGAGKGFAKAQGELNLILRQTGCERFSDFAERMSTARIFLLTALNHGLADQVAEIFAQLVANVRTQDESVERDMPSDLKGQGLEAVDDFKGDDLEKLAEALNQSDVSSLLARLPRVEIIAQTFLREMLASAKPAPEPFGINDVNGAVYQTAQDIVNKLDKAQGR